MKLLREKNNLRNINNLNYESSLKTQKGTREIFYSENKRSTRKNDPFYLTHKTESVKLTNNNLKISFFPNEFQDFGNKIHQKVKNPYNMTFLKFYQSNIKNKSISKSDIYKNKTIFNKHFYFDSNETGNNKFYSSTVVDRKHTENTKNRFLQKYKIKHSLDITRPKFIPELMNPKELVPRLQNYDTGKDILDLSLSDLQGRNILKSHLKTLNYDKEVKNLGKKFITPDKYFTDTNKLQIFDYKQDKKPVNFLQKITSYKILKNFKVVFNSPSDRSKYQKFFKNFESLVCVNKI